MKRKEVLTDLQPVCTKVFVFIFQGRYGNQMHLYYLSIYQTLAGMVRDIPGGREFQRLRSTDYAMDVLLFSIFSIYITAIVPAVFRVCSK